MINLRALLQFWGLLIVAIVFLDGNVAEDVPYHSDICQAWIAEPDAVKYDSSVIDSAFIILTLDNPDPDLLKESVQSIMMNSAAAENYSGHGTTVFLNELLIIDDVSDTLLQNLPFWGDMLNNEHIKFLRSPYKKGKIIAKDDAVQYLEDKFKASGLSKAMLVFMDEPMVVTPNWLLPLATTLTKSRSALAYPAVDILAKGSSGSNWEVARSDDVVAAFDWSFLPTWEAYTDSHQQNKRLHISKEPDTIEVFSPSIPDIFAVSFDYYRRLEGFDRSLHDSGLYHQENIDLSLRSWLCGSVVIRSTCSRVARVYPNFQHDNPAGKGIMQRHIDQNTMNFAQRFLSIPSKDLPNTVGFTLREVAYQSRFMNRLPYAVETNTDMVRTGPAQSLTHFSGDVTTQQHVGVGRHNQGLACASIEWFLTSVYPGLQHDISTVLSTFNPLPVVQAKLQQLVNQYPSGNEKQHVQLDANLEGKLKRRADLLQAHSARILGVMAPPPDFSVKHAYTEPTAPKKHNGMTRDELLDAHQDHVRTNLECLDFNDPLAKQGGPSTCAVDTNYGNQQKCQQQKGKFLTMCPKSCGFCDKDNKFCEDFYLVKCPAWHSQGMCDKVDKQSGLIKDVCRKSCGVCTPLYTNLNNAAVPAAPAIAAVDSNNVIKAEPAPPVIPAIPAPAAAEGADPIIDPTQLHREYLNNSPDIPDVFPTKHDKATNGDACTINGKPDGLLLARITVTPPAERSVRIFCSIYTQAKNHQTNLQATRLTWAKKCDGFIAFSTETDPAYSAYKINHEGEESYDNMWQKSRAIWKYIANHYVNDYDFFLLGGDDMFYIIENLRTYLASDEINTLKDNPDSKGLYLGRIFEPPKQKQFNSGGAGYILDQKSVILLGTALDTPKCFPHQHGFWEDVNIANCLLVTANITPYNTRDHEDRERFHPFNPGAHLTYRTPPVNPDWYTKYNPTLRFGYDCCSSESVSFHYIPAALMYELHDYVYHCQHKVRGK